jgi:hypothetical protein
MPSVRGGIRKFLDYCCNCLSERWWEGRPHFNKPIASVCHVTPRCEHSVFIQCFVDIATSSFPWGSVNLLPKPLKCFVRTLFKLDSGFSTAFTFQGQNSRTRKWRLSPNNPWACRYRWDQLWSLVDLSMLPDSYDLKQQHVNMCPELQEKPNEAPNFYH